MMNKELTHLLSDICNGETILFFGAGISNDSGLPIVNQIVPSILNKFNLQIQEIESVLDKSNNPKLPFELFIEILQESSDIDDLLSIYEDGEPNLNHIIISGLIKKGKIKTVITTNFDNLLEKALFSEPNSMKQDEDFEVIYDTRDFNKIDWHNNKIKIIKIHGSVHDKKNMAITIKQIASKKNLDPIKNVIDYVFSTGYHKNILILGYSASDVFDISPNIESMTSNKNVYFIQHSTDFDIEDIRFLNGKNPFKKFTSSYRIYINTLNFLKLYYDYISKDKSIFRPFLSKDVNWEDNVTKWYKLAINKYSKANKYYIPARIFYELGGFNYSLNYFLKSLEIEEKDCNEFKIADNLYQIGNSYGNLGDYTLAIKYIEKSLNISIDISNKEIESNCLVGIGNNYNRMSKFEKALEYHLNAQKIIDDFFFNDKDKKSNILHNIGSCYMSMCKFEEAIEYFNLSTNIAKEIGNKKGEGRSLTNIGNAYNEMGNYMLAEEYYFQSLDIARKIGDKHLETACLILLGTINTSLGLNDKADEYYNIAFKIGIEDKNIEAMNLSNIANSYFSVGRYFESLNLYKKSSLIYKEIGNRKQEGRTFICVGDIYNAIGEFTEAENNFEKALSIANEIGDEKGKSICYDNLGGCFMNGKDYAKALKYKEKSLEIARKTNNKHGIAIILVNISLNIRKA